MENLLKHVGAKLLRSTVKLVLRFEGSPAETEKANPATSLYLEKLTSLNGDEKGKEKADSTVQVDIYLPQKPSTIPLPMVINLHGSGFVMDTFGEDAYFCHLIANQVNCVVMDIAYSKAPERPFPAASEDIDNILAWIWQKEEIEKQLVERCKVKINSDSIALTGFSSGGNLALTTCIRAKDHLKFNTIKAVVAYYPSTNLAESPYDKPQLKPAKGQGGAVIPPYVRKYLYSCYLPLSQDLPRSSPLISPINATADCFPFSMTFITCECDSLAREAEQMAKKLQRERSVNQKNEDVEMYREEKIINGILWWDAKGQGHNWDKMCREGSEASQLRDYAYTLTADRLRKALYQ